MRGSVADPRSPHPLAEQLPAVYAEDPFAQRFATGLDVVLGPLLTVLDCLDAYITPVLAPEDFLDWLGQWIGSELDGDTPLAIRREAIATAVTLHRRRGTAAGLAAAVRLATGVTPEITESGGSAWSARPLGPYPGTPEPGLRVTLRVPDPARVNRVRLDAVVAAAAPAHLPFTLEVVGNDGSDVKTG
jgi:phage tail-like protein